MAYDNTNRGTIGKNKRKTEDKHPDIAGSINVDGVEFWLNGWQKNGPDGSTFYSLSVKRKEPKQPVQSQREQRPSSYDRDDRRTFADDLNDEIPF